MRQVAWHLNHRRSGHGKQSYAIAEHNKTIEQNGHGSSHGNVIAEHNKTIEQNGHGSSHANVIAEHNKTIEHSAHGSSHGIVIAEHNKIIEQNGSVISEHTKSIDNVVSKNYYNSQKDYEYSPVINYESQEIEERIKVKEEEIYDVAIEELHGQPPDLLDEENDEEDAPSDVRELIDFTWSRIDENLAEYIDKYEKLQQDGNRDSGKEEWKTIRIFISSTFTDFFAEREVIVKKVGWFSLLSSVFV